MTRSCAPLGSSGSGREPSENLDPEAMGGLSRVSRRVTHGDWCETAANWYVGVGG